MAATPEARFWRFVCTVYDEIIDRRLPFVSSEIDPAEYAKIRYHRARGGLVQLEIDRQSKYVKISSDTVDGDPITLRVSFDPEPAVPSESEEPVFGYPNAKLMAEKLVEIAEGL